MSTQLETLKNVRIDSLAGLIIAANNRKSVYCRGFSGGMRFPAALVQNFQGKIIHSMIERGLYIYQPKHPAKPRCTI